MTYKIGLAVAAALALYGCGGGAPLPPVVDMQGVDVAQYNRDLAHCENNPPAFTLGNTTSNCMRAKGYNILANN